MRREKSRIHELIRRDLVHCGETMGKLWSTNTCAQHLNGPW